MPPKRPATPDDWFDSLPDSQRDLAAAIRDIVRRAAPKADESLKWNLPWYDQLGHICYIACGGTDGKRPKPYVTLGFYRAVELPDPDGLFVGTGKGMRHVKVYAPKDIRKKQFGAWVKAAVKLNAG